MAKVIAAVITAFGLGKLMVVYLVNKFITLHGKGVCYGAKKPATGPHSDLV
jgi:hypothetical protein